MGLTFIFWGWHVSIWRLTFMFWGWHISLWTNWRLTIIFWGWHISIWTNLGANNSFSKSELFQSGPSERLPILTAQFDFSFFESDHFSFFPFWTTLVLNQLQSVSIWTLIVFLQTVSNWLDFNHGPVWNPAILVSEFQGFSGRFYQILIAFIICMIHLDTRTVIRPMEAPFLMTSMSHNHHYQIWRHQFQPRYRGSCQNAI